MKRRSSLVIRGFVKEHFEWECEGFTLEQAQGLLEELANDGLLYQYALKQDFHNKDVWHVEGQLYETRFYLNKPLHFI